MKKISRITPLFLITVSAVSILGTRYLGRQKEPSVTASTVSPTGTSPADNSTADNSTADNSASDNSATTQYSATPVPVSPRRQCASLAAGQTVSVNKYTKKQIRQLFYQQKLSKKVFARMKGKSYKKGCPVSKSELRYLRVLYYGFDQKTHIGELVVNKKIASDTLTIFYRLYKAKYPIEKMVLIDNYNGDDDASMSDNNTSCFNFRPVKGKTHLSNHSYGLAIDVNPLYNPYIHTVDGKTVCDPPAGKPYKNRSRKFPHKITHDDLCYRLFHKFGFFWGGDWNSVKDYQHFQRTS